VPSGSGTPKQQGMPAAVQKLGYRRCNLKALRISRQSGPSGAFRRFMRRRNYAKTRILPLLTRSNTLEARQQTVHALQHRILQLLLFFQGLLQVVVFLRQSREAGGAVFAKFYILLAQEFYFRDQSVYSAFQEI
jgi:hypothetical protein